jgi:hypothetical protein
VSTRIDDRRMRWPSTIYLVVLGFVLALFQTTAMAQTGPSEYLFRSNYDPSLWYVASGTWQRVDSPNAYDSTAVGASDVSVVQKYVLATDDRGTPTFGDRFSQPDYHVFATITNHYGGRGNLAGLVYDYVDQANYREAVFSPTGVAYLREIVGGRTTTVASTLYAGAGANKRTEVDISRINGMTNVKVRVSTDGDILSTDVFVDVPQSPVATKRAGLVTNWTRARFDLVEVWYPYGPQPLEEGFESGVARHWTPVSGNWSVVDGSYRDSAVQDTNISLLPATAYTDSETYTVVHSAELYNPYSGRSNLVGLVVGYHDNRNYAEVVFSPTGTVSIRKVQDGKLSTIASSTTTINLFKRWFDVDVAYDGGATDVYVNFVKVVSGVVYDFDNSSGRFGVVTHWSPGRFDEFNFQRGLAPETEDPPQEH